MFRRWCLLLLVSACTEPAAQPSSLYSFGHTGCGSTDNSELSSVPDSPWAGLRTDDFAGLFCVHIERTDDMANITYVNFLAGCGALDGFRGGARPQRDEEITLTLGCYEAQDVRCGQCAFQLRYRVELAEPAALERVTLRNGCADEHVNVVSTLARGEAESLACNYAPGMGTAAPEPGTLRGACLAETPEPSARCEYKNLACTAIADGDQRCLTRCEDGSECLADVEACTDGVCVLAGPAPSAG